MTCEAMFWIVEREGGVEGLDEGDGGVERERVERGGVERFRVDKSGVVIVGCCEKS